jgi:hypothetical protein
LSKTPDIYAHGFAMVSLAPDKATVDYYENRKRVGVQTLQRAD